jgi:hypothetical protein
MNLGLVQGREMNQTKIVIHPLPGKEKFEEIQNLVEKTFGKIKSIKFYEGKNKIMGISDSALIK